MLLLLSPNHYSQLLYKSTKSLPVFHHKQPMAHFINNAILVALLALSLVLSISPITIAANVLYPQFYDFSCPHANDVVKSIVSKALARDPRMAASLLRLHFHDCFVKVHITNSQIYCHLDASITYASHL